MAYLRPWVRWVRGFGWGAASVSCLLVCLSACLFRVGRWPPTHPLLGKGGKASQATHPSDPPQRRPTPATHPRSYRHVAGVRYMYVLIICIICIISVLNMYDVLYMYYICLIYVLYIYIYIKLENNQILI